MDIPWITPPINFNRGVRISGSAKKLIFGLAPANLKRLMKDFGMVTPISLIDGYLILEGVTSNRTPDNEVENAIVAININDRAGTIMVIFSGIGERFGQTEYFCTNGKSCTGLPNEVRNKIKEWEH